MYQPQNEAYYLPQQVTEGQVALHLSKVMGWMFVGLITTVVSALFTLYNRTLLTFIAGTTYGHWVVFGLQIALVLFLGSAVKSGTNPMVSTAAFLLYSVLTGVSLSILFIIFHLSSLLISFAATGFVFFLMAIYGYFAKKDLTKIGRVLLFALIGIIVTTIINYFVQSSMLDYVVSAIGIAVFMGLVAFDTQKIKSRFSVAVYSGNEEAGPVISNLAIYGALELYLDFINIFLYMLRFFGKRD